MEIVEAIGEENGNMAEWNPILYRACMRIDKKIENEAQLKGFLTYSFTQVTISPQYKDILRSKLT